MKLPNWIDDDEVISRWSRDGKAQKLPPWTGDDDAMLRWLEERLFAMADVEFGEEVKREDDDPVAYAIKLAKCGNVERLRKLHPDIAEFINLPKRERGKRFSNISADNKPIVWAARAAQRIRALWKRFYPEFYPRRGGNKSADWFAAQLWTGSEDPDSGEPVEITETMVSNRVKKL